MFRNAAPPFAAVLAVVTISTSADAMSSWQFWRARHPQLQYSTASNQQLKTQQLGSGFTRRLGPCGWNRYYVISNGQCVDMGNIRLQ
jgi:hypothetical protein